MGSSPAPRTPLAQAFLARSASNEGAKALRYPPPPGIRRAPQPERDPPQQRGVEGGKPAWTDAPGPEGRCGWHTRTRLSQAPQCGQAQRRTKRGGDRGGRGAARPPLVHEGRQRAQQSSGEDAGAARPPALFSLPRAPRRSLALWPQAPLARRERSRHCLCRHRRRGAPCRWRAEPSPLVPSVKSSVLCLAAAIVWRGPVPCLGRRSRETEGPRGVSGCGRAGSALRRGRPGAGGGRGHGQETWGAGAGPTRLLEEEAGTPPVPNLKCWV